MRKTRTLILIIAALALASCTGLRQAQKTSKTNPVEVNYGVTDNYSLPQTFWSDFTVSVPKEYRNPNTGILVVPRLQNRNGSKFMNMPACVAEERLHKKFNDRQTIFDPSLLDSATVRKFYLKEGDTKIQFTDTVLLEPWMRNSRLLVDVYADAYGRRVLLSSNEIPVSIVDVNSFANPEPMEKYYHTYITSGGGSLRNAHGFRFSLDSYSFSDEDFGRRVRASIDSVLSGENVMDYGINVTVSASPEGSFEHNSALANNRLQATCDQLANVGIDMSKCNYVVIDENWDGVRKAVENGSSANKGKILEIIDSDVAPDAKESRIRSSFGKDWQNLKNQIFPSLRYCDIKVVETLAEYYAPVSGISRDKLFSLNEEMISAITKGDYEAAESIANEIPNNGIPAKILCNKATVCMKAGSYDAAKALYKKCQDMEIARHNLGVLYLLDRKYAQAEPLLNEYDDINKAIVKVALGKYDEAREVLSLIPDSDSKQKLLKMTEK